MRQYHSLVKQVLRSGIRKDDRTGTGTISCFGLQLQHKLSMGFPLLTSKSMHIKSIVGELLWMVSGSTSVKPLNDQGITIWDEWADSQGQLGPVYGLQWRKWESIQMALDDDLQRIYTLQDRGYNYTGEKIADESGPGLWIGRKRIDQLQQCIDLLNTDPDSRRMIVESWNVGDLDDMMLPPCVKMFQFNSRRLSDNDAYHRYVDVLSPEASKTCGRSLKEARERGLPTRYLDMHFYQRSADLGLGVPFNIAQGALLCHMVAAITNHLAGEITFSYGDVHIYNNHVKQLGEQIERGYRPLPSLILSTEGVNGIDDFRAEHISFLDYNPHPRIDMEVSV